MNELHMVRIPPNLQTTSRQQHVDLYAKWIGARYWIATHELAKARYHANRAYFKRKMLERIRECAETCDVVRLQRER